MRGIRQISVVLCVGFLFATVGCKMSEQDEIKLGRESHPKFEQQFGGCLLYTSPSPRD